MKRLVKAGLIAAASAVALTAGSALAVEKAEDQAAAEAATAARIELLEQLGDLMDGKLGPMVRSASAFDAEVVKATADEMADLSSQISTVFEIDTRGFTLETQARDNIWQGHDGFLEKARALDTAIAGLQEAAAAGERRPVTQAIVRVGQACGACHDAHKND